MSFLTTTIQHHPGIRASTIRQEKEIKSMQAGKKENKFLSTKSF